MDKIDDFFSQIDEVKPKPFMKTRVFQRMESQEVSSRFLNWNYELLKPIALVLIIATLNAGLILGMEADLSSSGSSSIFEMVSTDQVSTELLIFEQ